MTSSQLEHYGVKGMHWGVRRKRSASDDADTKRGDSEDHIRSRQLKSKPVRTLSNKELQELNQRLQLERSFTELTTQTAVVNKGKKRVNNLLDFFGTATKVYQTVNSPLVQDIQKLMNQKPKTATQRAREEFSKPLIK